MAAYPYVRAAIIGHGKKQSPQSSRLEDLLEYLGFDKRAAYPYVPAAIIGNSNKQSPPADW